MESADAVKIGRPFVSEYSAVLGGKSTSAVNVAVLGKSYTLVSENLQEYKTLYGDEPWETEQRGFIFFFPMLKMTVVKRL